MQEPTQGVPIWLKKLLLGPIVKLNSPCSFQVSCLLNHFEHLFESKCASGIKEVTFVLIYMWFICWERPSVIEFAGGFIMFLKVKKNAVKAITINNCGYPYSFKPKTLLLTDGDHFLTWEGPEKVRSFYSKAPTLITETEQKVNTSSRCSNFAVVDHVVYWVRWCLLKSGTLPLTLDKFIKTVSFPKFFRKTPRWAEPIPTAGENPLLITLRAKTQVMVPSWLQSGPASFWYLFSSYFAQSSYLVRNISTIRQNPMEIRLD